MAGTMAGTIARSRRGAVLLLCAALAAVLAAPLLPAATASADPPREVRFSTFNVSMFRTADGELASDLADAGDQAQDVEVRNVAETIQRQRPDVLLLNEFDYDAGGTALERFQDRFLSIGQRGEDQIDHTYPVAFLPTPVSRAATT